MVLSIQNAEFKFCQYHPRAILPNLMLATIVCSLFLTESGHFAVVTLCEKIKLITNAYVFYPLT